MFTYDSSNAECHIYTFKEGLLSTLAHNLKLVVTNFKIEVAFLKDYSPQKINLIKAVFDTKSIRTVCAIKDGKEMLESLTKEDCKDIEMNISKLVLNTDEFPKIYFRSKDISNENNKLIITGKLTICGVTRLIVLPVQILKDNYALDITLNQKDFGITPFSALWGAIKIKPEIKIKLNLFIKKSHSCKKEKTLSSNYS